MNTCVSSSILTKDILEIKMGYVTLPCHNKPMTSNRLRLSCTMQ